MYEIQGPHVAWQHADLPIPRLACALPGRPPYSQPLREARSPGFRTTLGVAPTVDCHSGGEGISTASADECARAFINLFKNLSSSTECVLLSPHDGPYPPTIHSNMHKLGVRRHDPHGALFRPNR